MNDKINLLIQELAAKLGTNAEQLWEVLIAQAPIAATLNTLFVLIMIGSSLISFYWISSKTTKPPITKECFYPQAEWEGKSAFFGWLIWGIFLFLYIICICILLEGAVTGYLNPQYWALRQLIGY